MRPLEITDINDIKEDDMIAFERTNKDGTTVSLLGFVNRVILSADKTEISSFQLLPMVPSEMAPALKDVSTFEIDYEKDLKYSGLDTPHTVYGMGFKVTPDYFSEGTAPKLGYINEYISNKLFTFANTEEGKNPKFFDIHPDVIAGIGFPPLEARIKHERPAPHTNHEQAQIPHSGITLPWKKTIMYDYTPVEAGEEQPDIISNPWEDFDFK